MTDSRRDGRLSAVEILSGTADLLRRGALRAGIALAVLTAIGVAIDSGMVPERHSTILNLLVSIAMLGLQYWLTVAILRDLRRGASAAPRFWAFVLLGLVTTLGILAGMLLLIVPGLVLLVRWSISVPILLGSGDGVLEAMGRSWRETGPHFWPILLALLVIYAPATLLVVMDTWLMIMVPGDPLGALVLNLVANGGLIAGWHAAVVICVVLGKTAGLTEVFE